MSRAINNRVIDRTGNIVVVDFRGEPNPPAPRFPGARGLRNLNCQDLSVAGGAVKRRLRSDRFRGLPAAASA